jgi:phosphohistidine swiveling domain-containing protein
MRVGIYTPKTIRAILKAAIQSGERDERVMQSIELPPLICEVGDFYGFFVPKTLPNFIGHQTLEAPLIYLQRSAQINGADLQGKMVLIEQADPGFDWIFNYGIVGLITAYGGPNSHMAIRAAEFHLPAAIGIGEALLNTLKSATLVQLDCVGHRLTRIR